jgi:D-beta-D-heptose 7-phosphate kinase/D-beta-D-heptose 1-phosphate adenosyltransferase
MRSRLRAFSHARLLVLGDVMLDEFLWGKVARISPEAPVPVVQVTRQTYHVGGAANVAANARSLGGDVVLVGVVGRDGAGGRLEAELGELGIEAALVPALEGRPTTVKTRIVAHHQQVVRADRELAADIEPELEARLLGEVRRHLPRCRAVVVSDYQKGVVTRRVMREVLRLARRARRPLLVDPKVPHFSYYTGVSLVTPNELEAQQGTGIPIVDGASLERAGREVLRRLRCSAALLTRGEHGMSLFEPGKSGVHIETAARQVFDVTGAGDTVIATLGLGLGTGMGLLEAARLANRAAGIVVGKIGTATVTPQEILDSSR